MTIQMPHQKLLGIEMAIVVISLVLSASGAADSGDVHWRRNTFPGPGQGAGRCERIVAFGVSPVDLDFMLQMTDNGPLVYSNDGEEFFPADIPFRGGQKVGFHEYDGNIGYALIGYEEGYPNDSGLQGCWRTADRGAT